MSASAKDWKSLAEDEKCPQALETCAVSACGGFSVSGTEFHSLVAFAKDWKSLSEDEKCPQALGFVRLAPGCCYAGPSSSTVHLHSGGLIESVLGELAGR